MKHPKIGISLDWESAQTYSKFPWYALRQNYTTALTSRGAVVFPLIHDLSAIHTYLDGLDGVVVTGGAFDVDPRHYGENITPKVLERLKPARTDFEMALLREALRREMPILGICGGEQVLNVVLGGSLIQFIPDAVPDALNHLQAHDPHEVAHEVTIKEGTLLHSIVQCQEFMVNTSHRQSVKAVGAGVVISALAPDGIIEAIEYPAHPFCLGVQWHPEFECTEFDKKIFDAFLKACL